VRHVSLTRLSLMSLRRRSRPGNTLACITDQSTTLTSLSPPTPLHRPSRIEPPTAFIMADNEVRQIISQLDGLRSNNLAQAPQLLSKGKLALLKLNALVPGPNADPKRLLLGSHVLERGALISIRLKDTESFTRYFQQLQPFYAIPGNAWTSRVGSKPENQNKITGLYLLLLLSLGDYAGFHTVLEGLETSTSKQQIDKDEFIQYPVRLEQALMEGSYDRVWGEMKGERVPSEEFGVFSEVCAGKEATRKTKD